MKEMPAEVQQCIKDFRDSAKRIDQEAKEHGSTGAMNSLAVMAAMSATFQACAERLEEIYQQ